MPGSYSRRTFLKLGAMLPVLPAVHDRNLSVTPDDEKIQQLLKSDKPNTWVFSGDSVTQGAHHTFGCRSYSEIFSERVRWEMRRVTDMVINSGVNGTNTDHLLQNFDWLVGQFKPAVVSVMFGLNDCQVPQITPAVFETNLLTILKKIRAMNAIPVLQTPNGIDHAGIALMKTASREKVPDYIRVMEQVAKENKIILVNNWQYWNNAGLDTFKAWLDDPFHPNAEGHLRIARLFFKEISIFDRNAFTCSGKK